MAGDPPRPGNSGHSLDPLVFALMFRTALDQAAAGDPALLSSMLRSDGPEGDYGREALAELIAFKRPAKILQPRGRKPDGVLLSIADDVRFLKEEVKRGGGTIYGKHDEIVTIVLECYTNWGFAVPDREKIEHHLKRSKRPRVSRAKKQ